MTAVAAQPDADAVLRFVGAAARDFPAVKLAGRHAQRLRRRRVIHILAQPLRADFAHARAFQRIKRAQHQQQRKRGRFQLLARADFVAPAVGKFHNRALAVYAKTSRVAFPADQPLAAAVQRHAAAGADEARLGDMRLHEHRREQTRLGRGGDQVAARLAANLNFYAAGVQPAVGRGVAQRLVGDVLRRRARRDAKQQQRGRAFHRASAAMSAMFMPRRRFSASWRIARG